MTVRVLDPVQGLIDYVNDIKPYHTKVIESLIEYVSTEYVDVSILEDFSVNIEAIYTYPDAFVCLVGGYGTPSFGDPEDILILSPDVTIPLADYPAIAPDYFIVLSDRTSIFDPSLNLTLRIFSYIQDKIVDADAYTGSPAMGSPAAGSPVIGGSFTILGDKRSSYPKGQTFEVTGSYFNDRTYTVASSSIVGSPTYTVIEVYEEVVSNSVEGFLSLADSNNTGSFTVISSEYNDNDIVPHTIVNVGGISLVTPASPVDANQRYVSYVNTQVLSYEKVLGYSRALVEYDFSSPTQSYRLADEGIAISNIVNTTSTSFSVLGDFRSSNIFEGDELVVQESTGNDGSYIITSISYAYDATVGDYVTIFGVASVPDTTNIDGEAVMQIPSNCFVIDGGNYTPFFVQGSKVKITSGTYVGEYVALYSLYINGKTYIRVRETLIDVGSGDKIVSAAGSQISVNGDVSATYTATNQFNLVNSERNDGLYTISASSYDAGLNTTQITVSETFDATDVSGEIHIFESGVISALQTGFGAALDICEVLPESVTNTTFEEKFEVQFGYKFVIAGTDSATNKIYIVDNTDADIYNIFLAGLASPAETVEIVLSGSNNGTYTITAVESMGGYAVITVSSALNDSGIYSGSPYTIGGYAIYQQWFQYMVVNVDVGGNDFLVAGDATSDISNGMTIKTLFPDTTYTVNAVPVFDGTNTTISVAEPITVAGSPGELTTWIISI